jgi:DNA-binding LacI/PurR family transcriptional regulator
MSRDLNRDDFTPLYVQFYQLLKEVIAESTPGTNLPPERVLCEKYGVDRVTVRKSLAMLADEKLIERKQGRGTRILGKTLETPVHQEGSILFALCQGNHLADRIGEPFYARSMDELERTLHRMGERLVYSKIRESDSLKALCKRLVVKGVILAGMPSDAITAQLNDMDVPVIIYNSRINGLPSVQADNEIGSSLAVSHLVSLGHKHIGYFLVPGYANSEKRLQQFTRTLSEASLVDDSLHIVNGDWTELGGYFAMKHILAEHPRVTAVFTGNDAMAIGALRALDEANIPVPEKMSVIGFDGIALSTSTKPPLTTMQVDVHTMIEAACMMLFHELAGVSCRDMQIIVSTKLLIAQSTAPCPKE